MLTAKDSINASNNAYSIHETFASLPGYKQIAFVKDARTGVQAVAYQNLATGAIVIAYEGTNLSDPTMYLKQLGADFMIAGGGTPDAFNAGLNFYQDIRDHNPGVSIYVTGHSFGGAIAEYIGWTTPTLTGGITWGAPGIVDPNYSFGTNLYKSSDPANFFNYINQQDPVGTFVPDRNNAQHFGQEMTFGVSGPKNIDYHYLQSYSTAYSNTSLYRTDNTPSSTSWIESQIYSRSWQLLGDVDSPDGTGKSQVYESRDADTGNVTVVMSHQQGDAAGVDGLTWQTYADSEKTSLTSSMRITEADGSITVQLAGVIDNVPFSNSMIRVNSNANVSFRGTGNMISIDRGATITFLDDSASNELTLANGKRYVIGGMATVTHNLDGSQRIAYHNTDAPDRIEWLSCSPDGNMQVTVDDGLGGHGQMAYDRASDTWTVSGHVGEIMDINEHFNVAAGATATFTGTGNTVIAEKGATVRFIDDSATNVITLSNGEPYTVAGRAEVTTAGNTTTVVFLNYDGSTQTDKIVDLGNGNILFENGNVNGSKSYAFYSNETGQSSDLSNSADVLSLEYGLYKQGLLDNQAYQSLENYTSNSLLTIENLTPNWNTWQNLSLDPIGAFYDSQSETYDQALSIADQTGVLVDGMGRRVSLANIQALDTDHDGVLGVSEALGLRLLTDLNENGRLDAGELNAVTSAIWSVDWSRLTRGNALMAGNEPAAPTMMSQEKPTIINLSQTTVINLAQPGQVDLTQAVPSSNYRTLRDTDNRYWIAYPTDWIDWSPSQVKINDSTRNTLIGTDDNDNFNASYYSAYAQWFPTPLTNFLGGGGDDQVGGSGGNDSIWGGTGNDTLYGFAGDDKLYGEEGADTLLGQEGNDYLDGGTGDDRLFGYVGNDILNGGDGNDLLYGFTPTNDAQQTLNEGETDDDYLYGGAGDDSLYGGLGNDYMDGGSENDALLGGQGNDILFGSAGADELQGNEGNDQLVGGTGDDHLFGQVGNDILWGGDGNDLLVGFTALNDSQQTLYAGEADDDCLYGGAGADILNGGLGNDYLDGGTENDLLFGGQGDDKLFGGDGADELQGNEGNDQLVGGAGDDKLFGQVGNDTLWGGDGNDIMVGFTASNETKQTLNVGETDDDVLYGEGGNDNIYGGLGNDSLDGGTGNDILLGGEGNDTLFGGDGNDELQGNEGNDQLVGGTGDDKLFGQVGNDTLWGGDGNDLLMGFTGSNESKQTLSAGETDDDTLYGGSGSDILIGGLGNDLLYGGDDRDELQGGAGNDQLYGDAGDDNLFGEAGDDILYGGDGDDVLVGFTASNEAQQTLNPGETDNDYLYGGAGHDTLIGGVGDDYLDGGEGADTMVGGTGNDTYIVNSVNDSIYEGVGEGYDTVMINTNYLLNANIEELRLLEGASINGTGNALDNLIVGNSSDNILDGVTGADIMIGGKGNDIYYVDNVGDVVTELAAEGTDTVQSSISYTLGSNVENLVLLDFSKPESGLVDGQQVLVYGYPKRNELDYMQGDAVQNYLGTCALTSIANLITQTGRPTSESQVVNLAIQNNWAVNNPSLPAWQLGGSNVNQQRSILDSYGVRNDVVMGYNETGIANLVRSGRGVIISVNAGQLWGDASYNGNGGANHAVTLTGAMYCESDGHLMGFYIADSGRGMVSDMTRYVDIATFQKAANVTGGYSIYTVAPIKFWQENIYGTGNDLDNTLVGNRGDNVLMGLTGNDILQGAGGNDTLTGGIGDDTLDGGTGDDTYQFNLGDGHEVIKDSQGTDILLFGQGIQVSDVSVIRNGTSLSLIVSGHDSVRIDGMSGDGNNAIDQVRFADGMVWYALADGSGFNASLSGWVLIGGQTVQGQTLTLSNTLSDPDGLGVMHYQWQKSSDGETWNDLDGATGLSYTLGQSDVNQRLRAHVSYIDGRGNVEGVITLMTDSVTNVNDAPMGTVTVAGLSMQGQVLTASNTLADADGLGMISYQWQSSSDGVRWTNIAGAMSAAYTLTQREVGHQVRAVASYTDGYGTHESVSSVASEAVADVNDAPVVVNTLAAQNALQGEEWSFAIPANTFADIDGGDTLAYSATLADGSVLPLWLSFNAVTRALTGTPTNSEVGTISIKITATDTAGAKTSSTFSLTVVNVNDAPTGAVTVSGMATQGQVLTACNTLADADGLGPIGYQWQTSSDGVTWTNIAGAKSATYTLTQTEVGNQVRAVASYTDGFGTQESLSSVATKPVAQVNNVPTGSVTVSGAVQFGQILTAANSFNDLDGIGPVSYQWQTSSDGMTWVNIDGASSGELMLAQSFGGQLLRAVASYTDGYGTQETMHSQSILVPLVNQIIGTDAAEVLAGTPYNDILIDNGGNDIVSGCDGDDIFRASLFEEQNTYDGGDGYDIVDYSYGTYKNNVSPYGNDQEGVLVFLDSGFAYRYRVGQIYQSNLADKLISIEGVTGSDFNDSIYGNALSNRLSGGKGDDQLFGGAGDDQYFFARGYGVDTVIDEYIVTIKIVPPLRPRMVGGRPLRTMEVYQNAGLDTLKLGVGIRIDDLDFEKWGSGLVVGLRQPGTALAVSQLSDQITLQGYDNEFTRVETIKFDDGTCYSFADDFRIGTPGSDTLIALGTKSVRFYGGADNDTLNGGSGNDVLDGGLGNDTLVGGSGEDTYRFTRGDGQDVITDTDAAVGNRDVLEIAGDVSYDQLWFSRAGNDLDIGIIGTTDMVAIHDWYLGSVNHIEEIRSGDGKVLNDANVNALVQAMSSMNAPAAGQTVLSAPVQAQLAPVLAASWN